MTYRFNDSEGLRIAVEMEKRGVELYRHAQKICCGAPALTLLKKLENDERTHREEFTRLLSLHEKQDSESDYGPEQSAYLSALAADVIFPGGLIGMGRESGFEDPAGILRYAIQGEKDSILFYEAITQQTAEDEMRTVFSEIIAQERGHLAALTQMLKEEYA